MSSKVNPYQAPASNVADADDAGDFQDASKGRRFGTVLVDFVCTMVFAFVFGLAVAIIFGEDGVQALQRIPEILLGVVLTICYYVFFEATWGRTPGKLVFRTFVVSEAGRRPSFGQIVKRTLCRYIPFEPFSFFGERGWHDSISKTRVVSRRAVNLSNA